MRLGIFGGSFDPVHTGHVAAGRACVDQAGIDPAPFHGLAEDCMR
jgi:nicotinic acid mononucleotide adenylyltransferase